MAKKYVQPGSVGLNLGTIDDPWYSLNNITGIAAGDEILCDYRTVDNTTAQITLPLAGSVAAPCRLYSADPENGWEYRPGFAIRPSTTMTYVLYCQYSYWHIKGIAVSGGNVIANGSMVFGNSYIVIDECVVLDNGGISGNNYLVVRNCTLKNVRSTFGISLSAGSVSGCAVYNCLNFGIRGLAISVVDSVVSAASVAAFSASGANFAALNCTALLSPIGFNLLQHTNYCERCIAHSCTNGLSVNAGGVAYEDYNVFYNCATPLFSGGGYISGGHSIYNATTDPLLDSASGDYTTVGGIIGVESRPGASWYDAGLTKAYITAGLPPQIPAATDPDTIIEGAFNSDGVEGNYHVTLENEVKAGTTFGVNSSQEGTYTVLRDTANTPRAAQVGESIVTTLSPKPYAIAQVLCGGVEAVIGGQGADSVEWVVPYVAIGDAPVVITDAQGNITYTQIRVAAGVEPTITEVSPTAGSKGDSVTITGTNFEALKGEGAVLIGGLCLTSVGWSSGRITGRLPGGLMSGLHDVTVVTNSGAIARAVDAFDVVVGATGAPLYWDMGSWDVNNWANDIPRIRVLKLPPSAKGAMVRIRIEQSANDPGFNILEMKLQGTAIKTRFT